MKYRIKQEMTFDMKTTYQIQVRVLGIWSDIKTNIPTVNYRFSQLEDAVLKLDSLRSSRKISTLILDL